MYKFSYWELFGGICEGRFIGLRKDIGKERIITVQLPNLLTYLIYSYFCLYFTEYFPDIFTGPWRWSDLSFCCVFCYSEKVNDRK